LSLRVLLLALFDQTIRVQKITAGKPIRLEENGDPLQFIAVRQTGPMKTIPHAWICGALALAIAALPACSLLHFKKTAKEPVKPSIEAPKLIGRIASIPADKRFVLIQGYGGGKIEAGTILTTRGPDDRSANLVATGESLGQFTAADVQSGQTGEGDAVYSRHVPKPPALPTESEPTENKEPTLPEAAPKK
jgi:hypothetical protein